MFEKFLKMYLSMELLISVLFIILYKSRFSSSVIISHFKNFL